MEGLLLGLLHVVLYVLIVAIVVWLIIWIVGMFAPLPPVIVNLLWAVVAIIALILVVQLLLGGVAAVPRLR